MFALDITRDICITGYYSVVLLPGYGKQRQANGKSMARYGRQSSSSLSMLSCLCRALARHRDRGTDREEGRVSTLLRWIPAAMIAQPSISPAVSVLPATSVPHPQPVFAQLRNNCRSHTEYTQTHRHAKHTKGPPAQRQRKKHPYDRPMAAVTDPDHWSRGREIRLAAGNAVLARKSP